MADGRIKIAIEVDGKQVDVAANSLDGLGSAAKNAGKWSKDVADGIKDVGEKSNKTDTGIKKMVTSLGLVAIASSAFKVLSASMDDAIKRFDTLNKFPKVLQSLGVSAEDSERSIKTLSDGIDGLPTKLDDIASNAQRMYISFKDMDKATDSALALNNAFLASGASGADAASGTEQYIQALQKGKPDMMEWRNMQQNMSIALERVAEQYGITTNELGAALRSGEISMDSFNDKIIELGTGTGELAELARVNSLGLATSFENLKGSFSRGIANILESLNTLSKDATGKEVAEHIDSLKVVINAAFKAMGNAIENATPYVKGFMSAVEALIPVVSVLTPTILAMVAAYKAYNIIEKSNAILKVAQASKMGLTVVTKAHTVAMATDLKMTEAQTLSTLAQTGALKLSTLAIGVMTGKIGLLTAAKTIATAVTYGLKAALDALKGPVGWVVAGIGLLTAGTIALVKWLKKETEESKRLTKETEELSEATDGLVDTITNSSKAYEDSQKETAAQSKANKSLAEEITNLTEKENKSAAEKMILKDKIEQLNSEVTDLNLSYSEEADALNMSNEQLQGKVDLMAEQTSYNEALQRQVEIEKEQHEVAMQLEETNALREDWNQKLADGSVKSGEHKDAIAALDEQEALLTETNASLGEQYTQTETQITESAERIAAATKESANSMIIDFENLEGAQKEAFDSMKDSYTSLRDVATDAFDKIDMKTEETMSSMTETLAHNQKVVEEWGDNQAKLMKWAGENGYDNFIPYIENMGIDSAAELAVMAKASDSELTKFADTLEKGGAVAGESLKTSLGGEYDEIIDKTIEFVDSTSLTMKDQIKNANFEEIGKAIPDGVVDGVEKGTSDVSNATGKMMDDSTKAAKSAINSNSPSKVYSDIGGDMTGGLTLGINKGTTTVISTVKDMLLGTIREFKNINSSYYNIGVSAMDGLNRGLNARRGAVMATARNIANQVARTMQRSLEINSPSGVMDHDVGRWIPEGLIKGIERTAPKLYRTLDDMTGTMMQITTPELALASNGIGAGASASNYNYVNRTNNDNSRFSINIDKIENYSSEDVTDVLEQSAWIMGREGARLNE